MINLFSSRFSVAPYPSKCIMFFPLLLCVFGGSWALGKSQWNRRVYLATYSDLYYFLDFQCNHGGFQGLDAHHDFFQVHCGFNQLTIKNAYDHWKIKFEYLHFDYDLCMISWQQIDHIIDNYLNRLEGCYISRWEYNFRFY